MENKEVKDFLESLAELLDTELELKPEMELDAVGEWDSLSIVSFLDMVDLEYGKQMKVIDFKDAKTFDDLFKIVMK